MMDQQKRLFQLANSYYEENFGDEYFEKWFDC